MALEKLAGPFVIRDMAGVAIASATLDVITGLGYDDSMCGIMCNDGLKTRLIAWDGMTAVISDTDSVWYTIDLSDYPIISPRKYEVVNRLFADSNHVYNKTAGVREGARIHDGNTNDALLIDLKLPDRYIGVVSSRVYTKPHDLTGQSGFGTQEYLLAKGPWPDSAAITPRAALSVTRDSAVIAAALTDGTIIYYNHISKTQVQKWDFIGANRGAWYSERHDVWVMWGTDNQIYIYASTAAPSTLTNPAGAAPLKGQSALYSVSLSGAHLEPIAGELIEWELGAGSPGTLSGAQSETDESGLASIRYYAPIDGSGDVTINAKLRH